MIVNKKDSQITASSNPKWFSAVLLLLLLGKGIAECNAADINLLPAFSGNQSNIDRMAQAFTLDDLFKDESVDMGESQRTFRQTSSWRGFSQLEFADTVASPKHASKLRLRNELSNLGQLSPNVKWKLSARIDYDAIYDISDFYPRQVRHDQRFELFLRENYLDVSIADFDVRIGRQYIIWGEMVGLFFCRCCICQGYA